jgi:thiosulfate/3-mercaptopyruvate sulfurtransferase
MHDLDHLHLGLRSRPLLATAAAMCLVMSAACGGSSVTYEDDRPEDERTREPAPLNAQVFVTDAEVAQWVEGGALLIDARPREAYDAGHVPGAVWANGGKEFQDDLGLVKPDIASLQEAARGIGVNNDQKVIIYGAPADKRAGRLFWTLEYLGHGESYLYTPGHEALLATLGVEATTEETDLEGDFVAAYRESVRATAEEVRKAADGELQAILIDTRRLGEFEGTEDRGDPRQGNIPGAIFYYWEDVFDEDDQLRSKEDLQAEFAQVGLLSDDAVVIPYCQTGVRSAYVYAVLRWLGQDNAKNYDGSWAEWSRLEDYPIGTVEDPTTDTGE